MPGFFITNIDSSKCCLRELNNDLISREGKYNKYIYKSRVTESFSEEKLFIENNLNIIITDGILFDTDELIDYYETSTLTEAICKGLKEEKHFLEKIYGYYSGCLYNKELDRWFVFTSHLGDRTVFYYYDEATKEFIIGSELRYITDFMKNNNIKMDLDPHGFKSIVDFGYFVDNSTGIKQIKRLFPGDYLIIDSEKLIVDNYYTIKNEEIERSEEEYIELLEESFNKALKRIIRKNSKYNFNSIVDLSGGLDSRAICYELQKYGQTDDLYCTYAQSRSYEEETAKTIADKLNLEWLFYSLNSGKTLLDIDDLTLYNNGISYYFGITGGKNLLSYLNPKKYGIEFTGILGDVHDSCFIEYREDNSIDLYDSRYRLSHLKPLDKEYHYSKDLGRFSNNELYWLYARGVLAGLSTFSIRKHFLEPITPYGDKDFLEVYLSIPWKERSKNLTLQKWLRKYHPEAFEIIYSKTGMPLKNEGTLLYKIRYRFKYMFNKICSNIKSIPMKSNMNPLDYWFSKDNIRIQLEKYYNENLSKLDNYQDLKDDVMMLCSSKSFLDFGLGLFIISYIKNYLFIEEE